MVDASSRIADSDRDYIVPATCFLMADARTIATYNAKAADYAQMVSSDTPDASLQAFIDLIPQGGHVLDLGCGPGTASAHMRAAGLLPDPVDASQGMIEIARNKFGLPARLGEFDDIDGDEIYDGIWANFSLLHAAPDDLPRHFDALFKATKPGGIIHVGMKTGTGIARDKINRLYTYVTVDTLMALLTSAGYQVTYTKEGTEAGLAGTLDPFVIMRGQKT
jgi:SAM-dependent methyltransferase